MENLDKINELINSEDKSNLTLAEQLLIGGGYTEKEAINKVYGMNLKLFLRLVSSIVCHGRLRLYIKDPIDKKNCKDAKQVYDTVYFSIPLIFCMDGFSITIQITNGNYCSSENGYRRFGFDWQKAEWGWPSEEEELLSEDAEDPENIINTVGSSTIELLEKVMEKHGGINWMATLSSEKMKKFVQ